MILIEGYIFLFVIEKFCMKTSLVKMLLNNINITFTEADAGFFVAFKHSKISSSYDILINLRHTPTLVRSFFFLLQVVDKDIFGGNRLKIENKILRKLSL